MEKPKDTLEDALDSFQQIASTLSGCKQASNRIISKENMIEVSKEIHSNQETPTHEMAPSCQRSLKSEAVVNEIKRRIANFQNGDKTEKKEETDKTKIRSNSSTINQGKLNPYEDVVNTKIANQKMLRRLDNITEKLVNHIEPKAPKNLEVCADLGYCTSCKLVILDIAVVACGESFHQECFACHVCNGVLDAEQFYQFEGKFFCEKDKQECLNKCKVCDDYIAEGSVCAEGSFFHPSCFKCDICTVTLTGEFYVGPKGQYICPEDYKKTKGSCCHCGTSLGEKTLMALGKNYHGECFRCALCDTGLTGVQFMCWQGAVNCKECFSRYKADICAVCGVGIIAEDNKMTMITCNGQTYHQECYACTNCTRSLEGKEAFEGPKGILCRSCKLQS